MKFEAVVGNPPIQFSVGFGVPITEPIINILFHPHRSYKLTTLL